MKIISVDMTPEEAQRVQSLNPEFLDTLGVTQIRQADTLPSDKEFTRIRFLHLTDLHLGAEAQSWQWPQVKKAFFEDLENIADRCAPWDLVFFTGDLVFSGTQQQYKEVTKFLDALWMHFQKLGSDPLLMTVPGNHDLFRPPAPRRGGKKTASFRAAEHLKLWQERSDVAEEFWADPKCPYRKATERCFKWYVDWWRKHELNRLEENEGLLAGDFTATFSKDGIRLGVLGLNSAAFQLLDGDYFRMLGIHPKQFVSACVEDPMKWVESHHCCFLLTHHPKTWFDDTVGTTFDREIFNPQHFELHLYGHMHEAELMTFGTVGASQRQILQGSSLFGLKYWGSNSAERIHGYTSGEIRVLGDNAEVRFWPRIATSHPYWRMIPDHRTAILEGVLECTRPYVVKLHRPPGERQDESD
jgi:hypothetical protein